MISFISLLLIFIIHQSTSSSNSTSEGRSVNGSVSIYYRSDYKYDESIEGWYKLHEIPASWFDARKRCTMEDAILMSPIDENYAATMTKEIAKPAIRIAFTGINSFFHNGLFISYEGVPLQKINHTWAKGQPKVLDGNREGACVAIGKTGHLAIKNCSTLLPFLCFKRYKSLDKNSCGFVTGYEYETSADKCYKVYATPRKWSESYMTCAADDGELAVIKSENEANAIKKFFKNRDVYELPGDTLLVGVHSLFEKGEWVTVHGEPLHQAGYNNQKIHSDHHHCGGVFKNGEIRAMDCEIAKPFLCQKKRDLGD